MKQLLSLFLLCSIAFCSNAQVSKTVEVVTPGTLGRYFLLQDINTVNNLTVIGMLDVRDFKFIRDSLPSISVVDLSGSHIVAYSGDGGTSSDSSEYPADEMPAYGFSRTTESANNGYLKKIRLPNSLKTFGEGAFAYCNGLDSLHISANIESIDWMTFGGCSAIISVDPENAILCDVDGMLLDKSKSIFVHCPTSKTGACILPETVTRVVGNAFYDCNRLESIELPKSVKSIGYYAFYHCISLKSLIVNNVPDSIELEGDVFWGLNTDSCWLDVPYGTINDFWMAEQWTDFYHIKEHSIGMVLNKVSINMLNQNTNENLTIRTNVNWTIQSDVNWLTLEKTFGTNSDTIVLRATTNSSSKNRVAHLVVSGEGLEPKMVTVTQSAPELVLHVDSGGLANSLRGYDTRSLMMLKLEGTMNASDFFTINDSLPMLTSLDLEDVAILACKANYRYSYPPKDYPANTIPQNAFVIGFTRSWSVLSRIILPKSLKEIDGGTFYYLISLKEISIPDSVTNIWNDAFFSCYNMTKLELGKSVCSIGQFAFWGCYNLKTVTVHSEMPIPFTDWAYIFENLDLTGTLLNVPFGTKKRYSEAPVWKDFGCIIEGIGGIFSEFTKINLPYMMGSTTKLGIVSTVSWTVQCNQPWLQVNPISGSSNDSITLIAQANLQMVARTAILALSTLEFGTRTITVVQDASPKIIQMKAGELDKLLTSQEKKSLSNLVLTGTMDGRDFRILRDSVPLLKSLDIGAINILEYNGSDATSYYNAADRFPDNAFCSFSSHTANNQLEMVILPASATTIGSVAFRDCISLKSVSIPNRINSIETEAFSGCSSLTSVVLPNALKILGSNAYSSCINLTYVQFGDSLLSISRSTFEGCKALKHISLPKYLMVIRESAFYGCTGLTDLLLPPNVTIIESYVFQSCTSLSSIVLNKNLQSIADFAFYYCSNLSEINLPGSLKTIGEAAFSNCTGLKTVFVNAIDTLDIQLDDYAFANLDLNPMTLHVPYQTKALYSTADQWRDFGNIVEAPNGLKLNTKAVNLSERDGSRSTVFVTSNTAWTVTSDQDWLKVANNAGTGNDSLGFSASENTLLSERRAVVTFFADGVEPQRVFVTQDASVKLVQILAGELAAALTKQEKKVLCRLTIKGVMDARDFKTIRDSLPNLMYLNLGETSVAGYYGPAGTASKYSVSYPAETVPANAFYIPFNDGDVLLKEVILPTSVTAIGAIAFANCNKLESVSLPNSVISIGNRAFEDCFALKKIHLPEGLISIVNCFRNCYSLETVVIPNSVKSIGYQAFGYCVKLKTLSLGNALKTISDFAFNDCSALTSVEIPNSVESIGNYAFSGCQEMTSLVIGSKLVSIGSQAFYGCKKLTNVLLPTSLKTIGYNAFYDCTGLKNVSLPASLTFIDEYALGCSGLESITVFAQNPLQLSDSSIFYNVNKSKCVLYVPAGTKSLYSTANVWKDFTNIVEMEVALPKEVYNAIRIFPNPFYDAFSLQGIRDGAKLTVVDMNGKVLISRTVFNNERIEAENLAKGMYLVRLHTSEGILTRKLLKE